MKRANHAKNPFHLHAYKQRTKSWWCWSSEPNTTRNARKTHGGRSKRVKQLSFSCLAPLAAPSGGVMATRTRGRKIVFTSSYNVLCCWCWEWRLDKLPWMDEWAFGGAIKSYEYLIPWWAFMGRGAGQVWMKFLQEQKLFSRLHGNICNW